MAVLPPYTRTEKPIFLCCDLQTKFAASPALQEGFGDCLFVAERFANAVRIFEAHLAAAPSSSTEEEVEVKFVVTEQYPKGLGHTVQVLLATLGHDRDHPQELHVDDHFPHHETYNNTSTKTSTNDDQSHTQTAPIGRVFEKTLFSMWTPEVIAYCKEEANNKGTHQNNRGGSKRQRNVILFGVETHVCILQTVADLVAASLSSARSKAPTEGDDDTGNGLQQTNRQHEEVDQFDGGESYHIFVVVDGICSQRKLDHDIALQTMAKSPNVTLTTSESVLFQLLKDKNHPAFKQISALCRLTKPMSTTAHTSN